MKLFSYAGLVVLATVIVSLNLIAAAQGDTIFANRREQYQSAPDGNWYCEMRAFDMDTGYEVTPEGFFYDYTESKMVAGIEYNNGYVYAAGSPASKSDVEVYDATSGYLFDTIETAPQTDYKAFGLVFDSADNLYCGLKGGGGIVKIDPDGNVTSWGTAPSAQCTDMEIFGDSLYIGDTDAMGVWRYDLNLGGEPESLRGTSGTKVVGLTFDPDGAIYTVAYDTEQPEILKWVDDGAGNYQSSVLTSVEGYPNLRDVDYHDGSLYVSEGKGIYKVDLSEENPTPTLWVDLSEEEINFPGLLAIRSEPIPEPGALALLVAGLIGLLAYAWRRRK